MSASQADPATPLSRAAQVFRLLSCICALGFQIAINSELEPPALGWLLFAVLMGWSVACAVAYLQGFGRRRAWVLADVVVVAALVLSTRLKRPTNGRWTTSRGQRRCGRPTRRSRRRSRRVRSSACSPVWW